MKLVKPVPPLVVANVPASVIVPLDVIGPPEVVRPVVPPETSTLVTVPVPDPGVLLNVFVATGVLSGFAPNAALSVTDTPLVLV